MLNQHDTPYSKAIKYYNTYLSKKEYHVLQHFAKSFFFLRSKKLLQNFFNFYETEPQNYFKDSLMSSKTLSNG